MKKEIVYAFIDSQNLNLGVRSQKWRIDFRKFRKYLHSKYNVDKAYLFIGYIPANESLYNYLKSAGYTIVHKPVVEPSDESIGVKGNVDAELVLHTMIEFNNFDKAIIVSGDGDFHCLVKHLFENNKLLKVIVPSSKYSSLLREFSNFIVPVSLFKKKISMDDNKYKSRAVSSILV